MKRILQFFLLLIPLFSLLAENFKEPDKVFSEKIWVEKLSGIIFFTDKEKSEEAISEGFQGIEIIDVWVPDEEKFVKEMESFLEEPLSFHVIEEIKQSAIQFYQSRGYPIISVVIPSGQDITLGVLKVIINVGRLGKVKAEGAHYFSNEWIASQIQIKKGEVIQKTQIRSDLEWINQNPFRNTDIILEPGEHYGETDIVLSTKDRLPLRVYSGYENTGNNIAGSSRMLVGFNWGKAFGLNHQLNYLFIFAPHIRRWKAHTGSYIIPLPWRHIFEAYGSYSRAIPAVDDNFKMTGKAWQLAGRYRAPLQIGSLKSTIFFGYEFKRSNNFLTFSEVLLFDQFLDISQFLLGFEGDVAYSQGRTFFGIIGYLSPGGMTAFNRTKDFEVERPGAKSRYVYSRIRLEQVLFFPKKFSWTLNLLFQKASVKLLPTEQFSVGGFYTVRGYNENEVIGDNGILARNELHSPPIALVPKKDIHEIQILAFLDFGRTYDVDQNILSKSAATLASIGPGIRYRFGSYITARFDYGWQLKSVQRIEDPSTRHSRGHFSLIAAY